VLFKGISYNLDIVKEGSMMNEESDQSRKKIAIVGASSNRSKFGNKAVRAYLDKNYIVYPVHPTEQEVEGRRAYRSVGEIPSDVSLVSFYIPPHLGLQVIDEVAKKGIKTVYLNPGTESRELIEKGKALGLEMIQLCSILAVGARPDQY
jgi:predicted CoA-binding protein